jgi:hypothetical protein
MTRPSTERVNEMRHSKTTFIVIHFLLMCIKGHIGPEDPLFKEGPAEEFPRLDNCIPHPIGLGNAFCIVERLCVKIYLKPYRIVSRPRKRLMCRLDASMPPSRGRHTAGTPPHLWGRSGRTAPPIERPRTPTTWTKRSTLRAQPTMPVDNLPRVVSASPPRSAAASPWRREPRRRPPRTTPSPRRLHAAG